MHPVEKLLAQRDHGVCKFFNADTGFGFIRGDDGVERFFNANHICYGYVVSNGSRVSYVASQNSRGPLADRIQVD